MTAPAPLSRLSAYSTALPNGDSAIDIEGLALDLISICKGAEMTSAEFAEFMTAIWAGVEVRVKFPKEKLQ
jgi:hypothetical protein